ncbi:alpha/beta-hydrolase [Auriculariales sp. MPI-PUGE-AT-0066]|nr:alpha/beta-hydrolase [Auriculariales sp. MPI-PUGE-AT-0066]
MACITGVALCALLLLPKEYPLLTETSLASAQFVDPHLRRFNLVALDTLSHGKTEGDVPEVYGQVEAACDVAAFMDAVKLPACIIVGMSLGSVIGLQLALLYPKKVAGLYLVSPLGTEEPEDIQDGRREIYDTWRESFVDGNIDKDTLVHCLSGGIELAFSGHATNMVRTLIRIAVPEAVKHWGPGHFEDCAKTTVNIFTDHQSYDPQTLARLSSVPLALVHCSDDIAFTRDYMGVFTSQLSASGVGFDVHEVPGAPHFGSITHSHLINPLLARFVANHWNGPQLLEIEASSVFKSPFEDGMRQVGWRDSGEDSGEESDDNRSFLLPS